MEIYSFTFNGQEFMVNPMHFDSKDLLKYGLGMFVEPSGNCVIYDMGQIECVRDEYRPYLRLRDDAYISCEINMWGASSLYKFGEVVSDACVYLKFNKSCRIRDISYMFNENQHVKDVILHAFYDTSLGPVDAEKMFFHCTNLSDVTLQLPVDIYAKRMFEWCSMLHNVNIVSDFRIILHDPIQAFKNCLEMITNQLIDDGRDLYVSGDCYQMFMNCSQFINNRLDVHCSGCSARLYETFKNWKLKCLNVLSEGFKLVIRSPCINCAIDNMSIICCDSTLVLGMIRGVNNVLIDTARVKLNDSQFGVYTTVKYSYCTIYDHRSIMDTCFQSMEHCNYKI